MGLFEDKYLDLKRKGAADKFKWMEKIDQVILPSQKKRIKQNDKSVLREMILPSWVTWELLYDWATHSADKEASSACVFCDKRGEGISFKGRHVCWECFNEMKLVQGK